MKRWMPLWAGALWTTALVAWAVSCGCDDADTAPLPAPEPPREVETELRYVLTATLDAGMEQLNGIALDAEDRLYLAGSAGVRVLDAGGNVLRAFPTPEAAICLAVDEAGNIYVGLQRSVEVYDGEGSLLASWGGEGEFSYVTGIAVDGLNVYVCDAGNRLVHRYADNGDFINHLGARDAAEGYPGLVCPSPHLDCAVDGEGIVHVANPGLLRVERWKADGERLDTWGTPGARPEGFFGCCNPTDIALTGEGRVVTSEKGIPRVKVYDAQGKMLAYLGPQNFSPKVKGMDLAVDSRGRICVADPGDGQVRVFELAEAEQPDEPEREGE